MESDAAPSTARQSAFWDIFRAIRNHRNYRLFFGGQLISVIGTFLTNTATMWLAYSLTKSASEKTFVLGLTQFASTIPMFLLGPFGGVWVDRLNRQKLLVITQTLSMLQSFALAILALGHWITVPQVIVLALVQGIINAIDIPGRQAFLVEMVTDRDDLANAIALNSTMVHGARLIGPAAAGLLIASVGAGWCFMLDGISYLAVIAALIAMHIQPRPRRPRASVLAELRDGIDYLRRFPPARVLMLLIAVFSLSGIPAMIVLMPIFGSYYGGSPAQGARIYGFLTGALGLGALAGAIRLAGRKTVLGLGRLIGICSVMYALAIAAFAISNQLWLALLIIPIAGWGMITSTAASNTILQTVVEDDKRGRVMSFFAIAFLGMIPFGALIAGKLAQVLSMGGPPVVGASRAILLAAFVCLLASIRYWMILPDIRRMIRPIYIEKGILPQLAEGLQAAEATAAAGEGS